MSWNKPHPAAFADRIAPVITTSNAVNDVVFNALCAAAVAGLSRAR